MLDGQVDAAATASPTLGVAVVTVSRKRVGTMDSVTSIGEVERVIHRRIVKYRRAIVLLLPDHTKLAVWGVALFPFATELEVPTDARRHQLDQLAVTQEVAASIRLVSDEVLAGVEGQ